MHFQADLWWRQQQPGGGSGRRWRPWRDRRTPGLPKKASTKQPSDTCQQQQQQHQSEDVADLWIKTPQKKPIMKQYYYYRWFSARHEEFRLQNNSLTISLFYSEPIVNDQPGSDRVSAVISGGGGDKKHNPRGSHSPVLTGGPLAAMFVLAGHDGEDGRHQSVVDTGCSHSVARGAACATHTHTCR